MLTLPQLTCVFVCVCTSECVSLQPYLQISLMRNYWGAALIFFFATDNLFFKVTTYICLYFKTASCLTDEMKFHSKWKFILHPICALLSLVFTRLVLKWLWPAGVYKASLACERHRSHWKRGAIGKKLVPERRGRKEWKGEGRTMERWRGNSGCLTVSNSNIDFRVAAGQYLDFGIIYHTQNTYKMWCHLKSKCA